MFSLMLVYIFFHTLIQLYLFGPFVRVITGQDCIRLDSHGTATYCCDNHVRRNGKCVECTVGYTAIDEETCQPCKRRFYGRKCSFQCNCDDLERCHHVNGCIASDENSNQDEEKQLSTLSYEVEPKMNITIFQDSNEKDLFKENIVLFGGIGIFVIVAALISLAVMCLCKRRLMNSQMNKTRKENQTTNNVQHQLDDANGEYLYDIIDENEIYDDNIQANFSLERTVSKPIDQEKNDTSSSSTESGYLKPVKLVKKEILQSSTGIETKESDYPSYHSILPHVKTKPSKYSNLQQVLYLEVVSDSYIQDPDQNTEITENSV